jgi:hypothetical protein
MCILQHQLRASPILINMSLAVSFSPLCAPNIALLLSYTHTASGMAHYRVIRRPWSSYASLSTSAVGARHKAAATFGTDWASKGAVISVATTPVKRRTVCAKTEPCALVDCNDFCCQSASLGMKTPSGSWHVCCRVPSLWYLQFTGGMARDENRGADLFFFSKKRPPPPPRCFKRRWSVPE